MGGIGIEDSDRKALPSNWVVAAKRTTRPPLTGGIVRVARLCPRSEGYAFQFNVIYFPSSVDIFIPVLFSEERNLIITLRCYAFLNR